MKSNQLKSLFTLFVVFFCHSLFGQIWYKLELLDDGETYQISLVSDVDWSLPNNLTSTGQVTVKVPTAEFELTEFESVHPQLKWDYNARIDSPNESVDIDYLSFGLENASRNFEYEAGEETPIIRFKNTRGCAGYVSLLDNEADPIEVSTDRHANIGSQLTVLGARGNAYFGNVGTQMVKCTKLIKTEKEVMKEFSLFPNPAHNDINIKMNWSEEAQEGHFFIRDNVGRVVLHQRANLQKGENEIRFDIGKLDGGMYHMELSNAKQESISLDKFIKIYSASIDPLPSKDEETKKDPRN